MLTEYVPSNTELLQKFVDMMPDTIKGSSEKKKSHILRWNTSRPLVLSMEQFHIKAQSTADFNRLQHALHLACL